MEEHTGQRLAIVKMSAALSWHEMQSGSVYGWAGATPHSHGMSRNAIRFSVPHPQAAHGRSSLGASLTVTGALQVVLSMASPPGQRVLLKVA